MVYARILRGFRNQCYQRNMRTATSQGSSHVRQVKNKMLTWLDPWKFRVRTGRFLGFRWDLEMSVTSKSHAYPNLPGVQPRPASKK